MVGLDMIRNKPGQEGNLESDDEHGLHVIGAICVLPFGIRKEPGVSSLSPSDETDAVAWRISEEFPRVTRRYLLSFISPSSLKPIDDQHDREHRRR